MYTLTNIVQEHRNKINKAFDYLDKRKLEEASDAIFSAVSLGQTIFVCGNGGSAAIAEHWACDYFKGCSTDLLTPKVISLSSNLPLITAISNDLSYNIIYSYQLNRLAKKDDLVITISSSGNSPNIVYAIDAAKELGCKTISLSGFDKTNYSNQMSDISLWVDIDEYEATEDAHQMIMHILAKQLRYDIKNRG